MPPSSSAPLVLPLAVSVLIVGAHLGSVNSAFTPPRQGYLFVAVMLTDNHELVDMVADVSAVVRVWSASSSCLLPHFCGVQRLTVYVS